MRTKDELFRAAQREVAARRQRAVTRAEALRTEALRRHPEIGDAEAQRTRLGRTAQEHRGIYVNRAALYTSHAGTRIEPGSHRDGSSPTAKEMSYPRSHSVFSVNALQKYTLSPNKAHCFRYFNRNHASADGEYRKHGRGIHGARAENTGSTDGEYSPDGPSGQTSNGIIFRKDRARQATKNLFTFKT